MPQYTFFCEACSLQFKRRMKMGSYQEASCPECRASAPRQWEGQALTHNFAPVPGTAKANSGVAQHDYPTADNLVGRSAEMRWSDQIRRNKAKSQIRDQGVALARRDEGSVSEYKVLSQSEFDARKKLEGRFREEGRKRGFSDPFEKS